MSTEDSRWQDRQPRRLACELRLDIASSTGAVNLNEEAFRGLVRRLIEIAGENRPVAHVPAGATEAVALAINDLGDGLVAFFDDPRMAVECAFALRREFSSLRWEKQRLPRLLPRIALHAGSYIDEGRGGLRGQAAVDTARLESSVAPGEVWATEQFALLFRALRSQYVALEYLGERRWGKGYGDHPTYRLRDAPAPETFAGAEISARGLAVELALTGGHDQRLQALDALGAIGGRDVLRLLEGIAGDAEESFELRRMALLSVEEHDNPDSTPALLALSETAEPEAHAVRALVVQVLGAVGDHRALPRLIALVTAVTRNEEYSKPDPLALDLAERALLGLRHFRAPGARRAALGP